MKSIRLMILFMAFVLTGQMPEWSFFRDGAGNSFFLDGAGKIQIAEPDEALKKNAFLEVSGLEYSMSLGKQLLKEHRPADALRIFKTVLFMYPDDQRICSAAAEASSIINSMKKRFGDAFVKMTSDAVPLMFAADGKFYAADDVSRWAFSSDCRFEPVKKAFRSRKDSLYRGMTFGFRTDRNLKGYDFLTAVESEKFSFKIKNTDRLENLWSSRMAGEGTVRSLVKKDENRSIWSFSAKGAGALCGYEVYAVKENRGWCVRMICPEKKAPEVRNQMLSLAESFRFN